jgi:Ca2+-binding RTX toxin-like protein
MAITAETRQDIIELVVTAYGAAPGTTLLTELVAIVDDGGTLADVATSLTTSDTWTAEYPSFQTAEEFATEWLGNLVPEASADALADGVEIAVGLINGGASFADVILIAQNFLANLAEDDAEFGSSAANFNNKVEVASYYTLTLEQADLSVSAVSSVTSDDDSVEAANETNASQAAPSGEALSLTTGLDVALIGTAGDDTIAALDADPATVTGDPSTVQSGDNISGGDGTDTIVWTATANAAAAAVVASSGVEGLRVYNLTNDDTYAIDASSMTGLTDVYVNGGNATTTVSSTKGVVNVHLISTTEDVTVSSSATATFGPTATTILGNAAGSGATVTYDGIETVNLVAAGAVGGTAGLTIDSDELETINVSGDGDVYVIASFQGVVADTQTSTFNAADAGGDVKADITRGAGSDASSVTLSANDDTLIFNSAISKADTLVGGDGTDTLQLDGTIAYSKTATTQAGAGISGFEALSLEAGASVDNDALTGENDISTVAFKGTASYTNAVGVDTITQSAGTATLGLETDGSADELTTTVGGLYGGATVGLTARDMETINVVSSGLLADNTVTLTGSTTKEAADVTTVNVTGRGVNLTVGGESVATVDASGVSGLGSAFTLVATASEADMTVTGSAVVPTDADTGTANTISTGEGDDTITTGDFNDVIDAGRGDNVVDAGDGDNTVTTGRDDDTITTGEDDDDIDSGAGDDTIAAGDGDNVIDAGSGDDSITSGEGDDTITLGSGDDTVSAGAGDDAIYMGTDYDDDDVVDGGDDDDTLSVGAIVKSTTAAPLILQDVDNYVDLTPGTSRTSTPQFTDVEDVYMAVNLAAANVGDASDSETVDFSSTSGLDNLYLEIVDADDATDAAKLTLNEVDAAAIHLGDRDATNAEDLGELVIVGAGQSSLTIKAYGNDAATDVTVSDVDAVTVTAYNDSSTVTVGDSTFGDIAADDSAAVTVSVAGSSAATGGMTLTAGDVTADAAESVTLSAGANNTLALGDVTIESEDLTSVTVTVSDDAALTVGSITTDTTSTDEASVDIDVGINGSLTSSGDIIVLGADGASTIDVGANGYFETTALIIGDTTAGASTTITGTSSSEVDIDQVGQASLVGSYVITGRGELTTTTIAIEGTTTLKLSGWTDDAGNDLTFTTTDDEKKTFTGSNANTFITTGAGVDTITTGSGADRIEAGGGADILDGGDGADLFVIAAAADFGDVISDFEAGSDRLALDVIKSTQDVTGTITAMGTATSTITATKTSMAATTTTGTTVSTTASITAGDTGTYTSTTDILGAGFVKAVTITATTTTATTVSTTFTAMATGTQTSVTAMSTVTATISVAGTATSVILGGNLNLLTDSGASTVSVASTVTSSNSVTLTTGQVYTLTASEVGSVTGTSSSAVTNANVSAFKAAIVDAQTALAIGTTNYVAFGIGTGGTVFIANVTNTSGTGVTSDEITSVRTVAFAEGITATDIVLI